ncbi:LysR family transcriptional regulator [Pseudoalteromonas sp. MSK9-3]|uniref:LysR family transcriptional regulator n=1 Tax=Pseudoalteromonas sp. MSK9-3 TaxID=1897633 RepID=UPI000E6C5120|nr:LysR family transcriptional regulator [Pseudoalteromonas sp. MSK9-3]RJE77924.1 LysR family transcriptional regulator [Pseudoalteromonas sp. MSK9-3]
MDIELLKTFLEVVKTRHFGRAANNLYITQSAVSCRVRQLEQSLGVSLFSRQRNNIQLTVSGECLLPHAQTILADMQRAKADVALTSDQPMQFTLAATANVWEVFLHNEMHQIVRSLPDTALLAEVKGRQESIKRLLDHSLDLAFMFDPPDVDELVVKQVQTLSIIAVSTVARQNMATFFNEQYVFVDWGTAFSQWHAKQFKEVGIPRISTNTGGAALDLILTLGGSMFMDKSHVTHKLDTGILHHVTQGAQCPVAIYAVYHKNTEQVENISNTLCDFT